MALVATVVGVVAVVVWSMVGQVFLIFWPLLALGVAGWMRRAAVAGLAADSSVRDLTFAWLLVAARGTVRATTIRDVSEGGWSVDWIEHHHQALFFTQPGDIAIKFPGVSTFTAQPPLANLFVGLAHQAFGGGYAGTQLGFVVLGAALVLPAALWARRWSIHPRAATTAMALLFMLNPLLTQNLTHT